MGKQWKKDGKTAAAKKKGMLFTKIAREIQAAAKTDPNPGNNPRLRAALELARSRSMPAVTINKALERNQKTQLKEVLYEGCGAGGVGIIVVGLTDNNTRTSAEIRNLFKKHGGSMEGSVSWMFNKVGRVKGSAPGAEDPLNTAVELNAKDILKESEQEWSFYCDFSQIKEIAENLEKKGWRVTTAGPAYQARQILENLPEDKKQEAIALITALEEHEDCREVFSTLPL